MSAARDASLDAPLRRLSEGRLGLAASLLSGALLLPLLVVLDRAAVASALLAGAPPALASLLSPILVEELGKLALAATIVALAARSDPDRGRRRGTALAVAAIASFAAFEGAYYQGAFPFGILWERLLWSAPVHLVSALAAALALGLARRRGRALRAAGALVLSLAWHLLANSSAGVPGAEAGGPGPGLLALGAFANLALSASLARAWFDKVILGPAAGSERTPHA